MPILFKRLFAVVVQHIDSASWQMLLAAILSHMGLTWLALSLTGEQALLDASTFVYYYIVTTSTVGYGDFSPSTELGRWVVALWQIPFGLALFGIMLGKVGQLATFWIRRAMTGMKDFSHLTDHIIIFGWHPVRTKKIIDYILADSKRSARRILLVVNDELEHPFLHYPEVDFARLSSFTDDTELAKVALAHADKIILDGKDDDQTFTTALKISPMVKSDCHISAHFLDESKVELLLAHCHNVECSSSKSAEILVRSMQDPGSSRVQEELLSTLHGDTQFSLRLPDELEPLLFGDIFQTFKIKYNAILLGVAHDLSAKNMDLNPPLDYQIRGGDILHYIAPERILSHEVDWRAFAKGR
ncbi:potassium channel family protein [Pseudoalteromonas fenneropenaei]|uniref:Potassium channel family protein n=1 Tax=Pseudoalteromonas fenneropenaei TaxID=1737459 RepID=A0ABV7CQW4_9GAMM